MDLNESRKSPILPYAVAVVLFVIACILQQIDDLVPDYHLSKLMALSAQLLFFGILTYWMVSVISRVSDKSIKYGLVMTIVLMSFLMFLKFIKYNVLFDATAERYVWYAYYIPQCLSPAFLFLTDLRMGRKEDERMSPLFNLLLVPALLLILFVFTNDLHEQVFSFSEGLDHANQVYKWEWGYYLILFWIAGLYLVTGVLLFVKCRISHCRKKAWVPLSLFVFCLSCCILREVFNPLFIKMPETVVFSVVIVCESLIRIGLIPSNVEYARFFDMADVSAMIVNQNLEKELSSKNAPAVTKDQVEKSVSCGEVMLSEDVILKATPIRGGKVLWSEDLSVINRINLDLSDVNASLAEEIDLVKAENRLKERRTRIEEQNHLYREIFDIAKPRFEKIRTRFHKSVTEREKEDALHAALVQGVFLKRRSNLMLMKKDGMIPAKELLYAIKEVSDALRFLDVCSSVFLIGDGDCPMEEAESVFECFEDFIEQSFSSLTACLVRLSVKENGLSCRIVLDDVKALPLNDWHKEELERLGGTLCIEENDDASYVTLAFIKKEVLG